MSARIAVVDDDPVSARVMRIILEDEGFDSFTISSGTGAVTEILERNAQLVVLDINLPDMSGFTLCQELRARRYGGPIIFLSGRNDIDSKLNGFQLGADDYVVKPYEPMELVARIQTLLRRYYQGDQQALGTLLRADDAELHIPDLTYRSDAVPATILTPTEMRILECLMRNAGIVISRETLIERVWGFDFFGDTNRVDVYIRRVRRKIEVDPTQPRYIHTIRGLGYVFRPELDESEETAADEPSEIRLAS
jgi:DNA-binding response OmpR family regulator